MRFFTLIIISLISNFSFAQIGSKTQMEALAETLTNERCSPQAQGASEDSEVMLDMGKFLKPNNELEEDPKITLSADVADIDLKCSTNPDSCGWADKKTKMYKIASSSTADSLGNKKTFIQVKYCYFRAYASKNNPNLYKIMPKENKTGWIEEDAVRYNQEKPSVDVAKLPPPSMIEPVATKSAEPQVCYADQTQSDGAKIQNHIAKEISKPPRSKKEVESPTSAIVGKRPIDHLKIADALASEIGECPLDNPKVFNKAWPASNNVYDAYILPAMQKKKGNYEKLTKNMKDENGKALSFDQLVAIDSLARLLYAEMGATCYGPKNGGSQYAETVARIVVNRDDDLNSSKFRDYAVARFISGNHATHNTEKPTLAMVATTPGQFSFWNKSILMKNKNGVYKSQLNNHGLTQGLCPPSNPNKEFAAGRKPAALDQAVWRDYVRIATRAVLFKNQFKEDTAAVNVRHYTSGVDINRTFTKPKKGEKIIYPEIHGASINSLNYTPITSIPANSEAPFMNILAQHKTIGNKACLRLWDDKVERRKYAGR